MVELVLNLSRPAVKQEMKKIRTRRWIADTAAGL
jgi:hypothetical protein